MARPQFWLKYQQVNPQNQIEWPDGDLATVFRGRICTNEEKTEFANLTGVQVQVVLSNDGNENTRFLTRDVTIAPNQVANKGAFQFVFQSGQLPTAGEWKIEVMMKTGGNQTGITHHEDFNVI
jgi:hypothetical protein